MKMKDALVLYFARAKAGKKTLDKLLAWDENKTIKENEKALKINDFGFAWRYKLPVEHGPRGIYRKLTNKALLFEARRALRKAGWPLEKIGKLQGVNRQAIEQNLSIKNGGKH